MARIQLRADDARLVYLATVYHLGRPGSETDPDTLRHHDLGLGPLQRALEPQLDPALAVADIEVSAYQLARLDSALLGIVNELKQFQMADGRSAVPGFAEAVRRLYPETEEEPGIALDLVGEAVMLQRRLQGAVRQAQADAAEAAPPSERRRRPWWKIWAR